MIFVTVGHQMPFDRLIRVVDDWAGGRPEVDVLAQIGRTSMRPRHLRWVATLDPDAFRAEVLRASCIVAHAGMGTILTALQLGKPILVLPRRAALHETRSDHQIATAERFAASGRVRAVFETADLPAALDRIDRERSVGPISPHASEQLLRTLRSFIEAEGSP